MHLFIQDLWKPYYMPDVDRCWGHQDKYNSVIGPVSSPSSWGGKQKNLQSHKSAGKGGETSSTWNKRGVQKVLQEGALRCLQLSGRAYRN